MTSPRTDECSFEALEAKVLLSASIFDVDLIESAPVENNGLVLIQEDLSEHEIGVLAEEFESFVVEPGEFLQGEGELNAAVVNHGVIAPGNSPGEVEFESLDNSGGELFIEIGGAGQAGVDYDLVTVEEGVTLGGKLKVSVIDGYNPQIGDEFEFFDFQRVDWRFS